MLLIPENILNIPIDFISIAFPMEMCKGNTPSGGYGKDGAPVGTGRGCAPLCGAGNTPPIFFGLAKENGPRPVQKKNAAAQNGTLCLFCLKRGVPTRNLGQLRQDSALGADPALLNLSAISPRPGIAKPGCKTDLTCFSFRCRSRSGGEVQNRGPAGPLVWSFQGGPGGNRNPPGFLFRGRGGTLLFLKEKCPPIPRRPKAAHPRSTAPR